MKRNELISFLNNYLEIERFQDFCHNGLQISGAEEVLTILSGVTLSRRLIEEAIRRKAELILVHHGLFRGDIPDPPRLEGVLRDRLALLLSHNINLVAYHLPLDAHPEIGHNAVACRGLGLQDLRPLDVGFIGRLPSPESISSLEQKVQALYERQVMTFPYGPSTIQKVAIISGGSCSLWEQVCQSGAELFICGEMKESVVRKIEEAGLNVMAAGHYHTETLGIKALSRLIEKNFRLEVHYLNIPSPV